MAQFQPIVSTRYPYLDVRVQIGDWQEEALALVDTGFSGNLVVPEDRITEELGLPYTRTNWRVADGGVVSAPVYLGDVEVLGASSPTPSIHITFLGNQYILGRGILDRFRITLDHGQRIIVEP